jgi:hypothetical protein
MTEVTELEEEQWCDERRAQVVAYLAGQKLTHGEVGEWPAWHIAPYVSIWAIESLKSPGWVGWWAICGDLPTDYCSASQPAHPRKALREFIATWSAALAAFKPGDEVIGETGLPAHLAPLLRERVRLLKECDADEDLWQFEDD